MKTGNHQINAQVNEFISPLTSLLNCRMLQCQLFCFTYALLLCDKDKLNFHPSKEQLVEAVERHFISQVYILNYL